MDYVGNGHILTTPMRSECITAIMAIILALTNSNCRDVATRACTKSIETVMLGEIKMLRAKILDFPCTLLVDVIASKRLIKVATNQGAPITVTTVLVTLPLIMDSALDQMERGIPMSPPQKQKRWKKSNVPARVGIITTVAQQESVALLELKRTLATNTDLKSVSKPSETTRHMEKAPTRKPSVHIWKVMDTRNVMRLPISRPHLPTVQVEANWRVNLTNPRQRKW
jgi:hypothetical protein